MRVRVAILALALVAALTACGGGDDKDASSDPSRITSPTAELTETTLNCGKFNDTAKKIIDAQTKIFTGTDAEVAKAAEALTDQLEGLKKGAPDDVKAALTNLSAAFTDIIDLRKNPNGEAQTRLASLGAKLAADGQKISAYIVSKCS